VNRPWATRRREGACARPPIWFGRRVLRRTVDQVVSSATRTRVADHTVPAAARISG